MAENNEKITVKFSELAKQWNKKTLFASVPVGIVLVKKSIITGKVFAKGTYVNERIPMQEVIRLHDASDKFLEEAKKRLNKKEDIDKIKKEQEWRKNPVQPVPDEIANATLPRSPREAFRRRINAKYGLHIRWPWQSFITLPMDSVRIDTPPIEVDPEEGSPMIIDTDYRCVIIDPELYARKLNSAASRVGSKKASAEISKQLGDSLDTFFFDYAKRIGLKKMIKMKSINLTNDFKEELTQIGLEYGVEITQVLGKVKLPQSIREAIEEKEKATIDAEAEIIRAQGKSEATKKQGEAEAHNEAFKFKSLLDALDNSPTFSGLSEKDKIQLLHYYLMGQNGKGVFIEGAGAQPDNQMAQVLAAMMAMNNNQPGQTGNDGASLTQEENASKIKELCEKLGLIDEEGYLDRKNSKIIAQQRGVELKPGEIYNYTDVTYDEVFELSRALMNAKEK